MNELLIVVAIICKSPDLAATKKCVLEYASCADNYDYLLRRQSGDNKAIFEQGLSECVKSLATANKIITDTNARLDAEEKSRGEKAEKAYDQWAKDKEVSK